MYPYSRIRRGGPIFPGYGYSESNHYLRATIMKYESRRGPWISREGLVSAFEELGLVNPQYAAAEVMDLLNRNNSDHISTDPDVINQVVAYASMRLPQRLQQYPAAIYCDDNIYPTPQQYGYGHHNFAAAPLQLLQPVSVSNPYLPGIQHPYFPNSHGGRRRYYSV